MLGRGLRILGLAGFVLVMLPGLFERAALSRPGVVVAEGESYSYLLEHPASASEAPPLVIALHGYGGNIWQFRTESALNRLTEYGYGVLWVQALPDRLGVAHWNARLDLSDRNDLDALIEIALVAENEWGFDAQRLFLVGYSNGGFMAYSAACQTKGVFRAIVAVAATISGPEWALCPRPQEEPLLHLHGRQDQVVPMDGSMDEADGWGGAPAVSVVVDDWARRLGLEAEATTKGSRRETHTRYVSPTGHVLAELVEIHGASHDWPAPGGRPAVLLRWIAEFLETLPAL